MPRFKVTFEQFGKEKSEYVEATDSKEAIDKVCDKFDVGYTDIVDVEGK